MLSSPDVWLYQLSAEDVVDLESAAQHFLSLGHDVGEITKETFPLTTFSDHVLELRHKILNGVGFEVLRGLPIANYTQKFS
ncbi:MAG: TauD/TfdA family dioxygenase, partial [Gammaproteobacteria bacterium]|nr:TauD/TfdA family dioxygenase [Gammaproteobacteria bacterium]